MQKITFKNTRNGNLVGSLWKSPSDTLIIMVHGSDGNRFAKGLFEPIAHALHQKNYTVLAFDFSGHGESDDALFSLKASIDDVQSAIEYARSQGYAKIALFGHSFGALACLHAASEYVATMVLLGGMTGPVFWKWEDWYSPEQVQQIRDQGYASTPVNDGLRAVVKSDVGILDELGLVDQKTMATHIHNPILMIHGDGDQFERSFLAISEQLLLLLPKGSELKIIPGAGHSFLDHKDAVVALTTAWYEKYF